MKQEEQGSSKDGASATASYNIFRDSLLRYAGYANEVGESFRYQFPKLVLPSYAVSFGYCLADAGSTGWETWQTKTKTKETATSVEQKQQRQNHALQDTARATLDVLLWQSLASVMIPGATINLVVKASRFALQKSSPVVALPVLIQKWLPTATGLVSIPIIIQPIDHAVDMLLDNTTRVWWPEAVTETTSSPDE